MNETKELELPSADDLGFSKTTQRPIVTQQDRETLADTLGNFIKAEKRKEETQAQRLLKLAESLPLFHDQHKQPFTILNGETVPLSSNKVRDFLSYKFYHTEKKAANSDSVNQTITVLKGKAIFECEQIALHTRIAERDGAFYYDLLDKKIIKTTTCGWSVDSVDNVDDSGASWKPLFRRYAHQMPQVEPIKDGDPWEVFNYLNISPENRLLVLVYIISCFIPDIPHPIFHPFGSQGAGKTTLCNIIKWLCDPSSIGAIISPRDAAQLVQVLSHHHICLFDNLSDLPGWMSDILAVASTGGGFSKRQLYTNDEDVIYNFKKCVGLNGINTLITRPDLMDRAILLHLERIAPSKRIEEKILWESFEHQKPYILGGIFDAFVKAMRIYPDIKTESLFRMADFTKWSIAITKALGKNPEEFLEAYRANIEQQNEEVIINSTLAQAVLRFMESRDTWEGTVKEAWTILFEIAKPDKADNSFPKTEKQMRRGLNRLKANLSDAGLTFKIGQRIGQGIPIAFQKAPKTSTLYTSSTQNTASDVDSVDNVDDLQPFWKSGEDLLVGVIGDEAIIEDVRNTAVAQNWTPAELQSNVQRLVEINLLQKKEVI
jgi:hypothetical protein